MSARGARLGEAVKLATETLGTTACGLEMRWALVRSSVAAWIDWLAADQC